MTPPPEGSSTARRKEPSRLIVVAGRLGLALALLAGLGAFAPYLGSRYWAFDQLSLVQPQLGLVLLASTLVLLPLGRRRTAALALLATGAAVAPWLRHVAEPARCPAASPVLRVLTLAPGRAAPEAAADAIRRADAELVFLLDADRGVAATLTSEFGSDYPHRVTEGSTSDRGVMLLSRVPLLEGRIVFFATAEPTIVARVSRPGGSWTIIGVVTPSPWEADGYRSRSLQFEALATRARITTEPVVVLGSLGAAPWSHALRAFGEASSLRAASRGVWASGNVGGPVPLMRVPGDQALISSELCVVDRRVMARSGTFARRPVSFQLARSH